MFSFVFCSCLNILITLQLFYPLIVYGDKASKVCWCCLILLDITSWFELNWTFHFYEYYKYHSLLLINLKKCPMHQIILIFNGHMSCFFLLHDVGRAGIHNGISTRINVLQSLIFQIQSDLNLHVAWKLYWRMLGPSRVCALPLGISAERSVYYFWDYLSFLSSVPRLLKNDRDG